MDAMTAAFPRVTDGEGLLIVLNVQSGAAVLRSDPRPVFQERLPAAVVCELVEGQDLAELVAQRMAAEHPPLVFGVYGGDGTVSRMAGQARHYGLPLLVLPGGTFNHFARSLGVDSLEVALGALEAGSGRAVTVVDASADGEDPFTVLNAVSVGTYPAFLDKRENDHEQFGKWLGGLAAARRELRDATPIAIVREGRRALVWSVFAGVGRNEPDLVATMQRGAADDGLLDVRIHHARGPRLRALASSLTFGPRTATALRTVRLMPPETDVERLVVHELTLAVRPAPGRPAVWVHDGELEEGPPSGFTLHCVAVPAALRVYAPPPPVANGFRRTEGLGGDEKRS